MTLRIDAALKDGIVRLAGVPGLFLMALFTPVTIGNVMAINGIAERMIDRDSLEISFVELFQPALDVSMQGLVAIAVVCLLFSTYLTIVATKTFVAGNRRMLQLHHLVNDVFWPFLNLVVGTVVVGALILVGTAALVVPGIIVAVSLVFVPVFVVDEHENVYAAVRDSWEVARGSRWRILGLMVVLTAITGVVANLVEIVGLLGSTSGAGQSDLGWISIALLAPTSLFCLATVVSAYDQLYDFDESVFGFDPEEDEEESDGGDASANGDDGSATGGDASANGDDGSATGEENDSDAAAEDEEDQGSDDGLGLSDGTGL